MPSIADLLTLHKGRCVNRKQNERRYDRSNCRVPDDYIGTKIGSLLRAREIMELLVSTSVPENAQ